jgi:hypothetical protein
VSDSPITLVAQAVTDTINSTVYSQSVVAIRTYRPVFELDDPKIQRVYVVPRGVLHAIESRDSVQTNIQIDIGIFKKVDLSLASLDVMMGLVEEIAKSIRTSVLYGGFNWVETANVPIYSPDNLDQSKEFLSILTLTFRAVVPR